MASPNFFEQLDPPLTRPVRWQLRARLAYSLGSIRVDYFIRRCCVHARYYLGAAKLHGEYYVARAAYFLLRIKNVFDRLLFGLPL